MVSTIPFDAMPKFNFTSGRKNNILLSILLLSITVVVFIPQKALFPLAVAYILYSVFRGLFSLGKSDDGNNNHNHAIMDDVDIAIPKDREDF